MKNKRIFKTQGQTLVDAVVAIGLLSLVTLSVMQMAGVSKTATQTTQVISEVAQLYSQLSSIVSSETSCRIAMGGPTTYGATVAGPLGQPYNGNLIIYQSDSSNNQTPLYQAGSQFGHLTIKIINLIPHPASSAPVNGVGGTFAAELQVFLVTLLSPTSVYNRTIQGIFLTVQVDPSLKIISCSPLSSQVNGDQSIFQQCPANQAPTSSDGTHIQCQCISCPSGSTPGTDSNGNLTCTDSGGATTCP